MFPGFGDKFAYFFRLLFAFFYFLLLLYVLCCIFSPAHKQSSGYELPRTELINDSDSSAIHYDRIMIASAQTA